MRLLFLCGREIDYTRNQILLRSFQQLGDVDVVTAPTKPKSLILRSIIVGLRCLPLLLFKPYDLVFVGFYGSLIMLEVGLFYHGRIVFDAFVSNFDTLVSDRNIIRTESVGAKALKYLDRITCLRADIVLLDTQAHTQYFVENFSLPKELFQVLPVGAVDRIFYPRQRDKANPILQILAYSSYLPLHGMDIIISAAALLNNLPIEFRLIGAGQEYSKVMRLAEQMGLKNVKFLHSIPLTQLPAEISRADICLGGHFGNSDKAVRTIPGKIYQMLAMGRAVIAADSPANRELLTHLGDAYLCLPGDPVALANAIRVLSQDEAMRHRLEINGRETYLKTCSEAVIQQRLREIVAAEIFPNEGMIRPD